MQRQWCEGEGRGLLKSPSKEGTTLRENQPTLTFITGDQHLAFGLEVGRDEVAESMGQDVVCFVVDVLPTMGTSLKGQRGRESESSHQGIRKMT